MSIINSQPLIGASGQGGYFLTKSLRFRSSASAYLNRTLGSSGSLRAWTWSAWVKRGTLGVQQDLFGWVDLSGGNFQQVIGFNSDNTLEFQMYNSALGGYVNRKTTTQVFRDPSAWYHIVVTWDSNNATADDRARIYINGTRVTAWANNTNPSLNQDSYINNSSYPLGIGRCMPSSSNYFDGYLAEVNFVNAQALTPSSFGQTDSATGVWQPAKYTGTYGTNGFYLPFTNTTSTSTLGNDFSGNGNNWTVNNISLTSGATYDSMNDVPTLTSATTANYCVLNPLNIVSPSTISGGNLNFDTGTTGGGGVYANWNYPESGKFYHELSNLSGVGTANGRVSAANVYWESNTGDVYISGVFAANVGTWNDTNTLGFAADCGAKTIALYRNNSLLYTASAGNAMFSSPVAYAADGSGSFAISGSFNFGQRPFAYTPPTGFVALNTYNLPTPTIGATASTQAGKYFNTVLYTGTGSTPNSVTGVGFQPDFLWIKSRSNAYSHLLANAITTANNTLQSDSTAAEQTYGCINSFNSDGFTVDTDGTIGANNSGSTFVAWNWKANGSGSTNTAGSITSTVSANTTAGFSIVTYTGNSTSGATVGHGLNSPIKMLICKQRNGGTYGWNSWHTSLGTNYYIALNSTGGQDNSVFIWDTAGMTSSVFKHGSDTIYMNNSGSTYVAYCFAQVAGYSAFGSYTGNGSSDGAFVFTGFRPRFLIVKRTNDIGSWIMTDSARSTYNVTGELFNANTSGAEFTTSDIKFDYLSNGFKLREVNGAINASGSTYIYMAFAENPFKYSLAR